MASPSRTDQSRHSGDDPSDRLPQHRRQIGPDQSAARPVRKGGFSRELGTDYGSVEFFQRYEAALLEHRTGKKNGAGATHSIPGSVNDLIASWYKSPEWKALADLMLARPTTETEATAKRRYVNRNPLTRD